VRAVERAFHCLAQGSLLRVLHNHRCPGNRLQRDPLKTERETEREDGSEARSGSKHGRRLPIQSRVGKRHLYKRKPFASSGEGFRRLIFA
jgi:hypothetical protein